MDLKTTRRLLAVLSCGLILSTLLVFKRVILTHKVNLRSNIVVSLKNGSELFEEQPLIYSTSIPIHKMRYDLHPPFSKDVVVHTAYFDQRPRDKHINVTVIFLNINKTIMDNGWVVGCGVDGRNASAFSLYSVFENELMHNWLGKKPFMYENMEVLCYDMPGKNGSEVFVVYKTAQNSHEIREISQYPLYIPAPRVSPSGEYNFTTVTCTKINDRRVPFFHEFVQYQKTLGVDHVHVSILDLFINDKGFQDLVINDTFLWKLYEEGYLTFSVWKGWYAEGKIRYGEVSFHSEILRKLDCIYRFLGTYDFAMPLDTDDFLVPRIPGKTKLKDYILQYCYSKPAGSCRFKWIWHYPQCGINGKVVDGNVTKHLKTKIYNPYEVNFKSVHSTRVILDASFHDAKCPKCLRPGYHLENISTSIAYVAHNRYKRFKGQSPCANKGPLL